ncbi:MAG: response regulator, partial [Candidatus Heimdallarchaeota archaeon]|nr:response regulator [Candidatus Heimdallarchaeota archaeon]
MSEEQLVDETDNNSIHSTLVAKKNILIIDDDIEFTMAIARTLQDLYKVDIANTLKVAAQKLTLKEFPVILLDYDFGEEINGINFSNYIKQLYPLSHVIMATGYLDYDIAKEALNNGSVNYFMTKPIDT